MLKFAFKLSWSLLPVEAWLWRPQGGLWPDRASRCFVVTLFDPPGLTLAFQLRNQDAEDTLWCLRILACAIQSHPG